MSKLSFSQNLKRQEFNWKKAGWKWFKGLFRKQIFYKTNSQSSRFRGIRQHNLLAALMLVLSIFLLLTVYVVELTIIQGQHLYTRSVENHLRKIIEYPNRGIIKTSDNVIVAKNNSSVKLYLDVGSIETNGVIDSGKLKKCSSSVEALLGDNWKNLTVSTEKDNNEFSNIQDYIKSLLTERNNVENVLLFDHVDESVLIDLKASPNKASCIFANNGTIRYYPESFYYAPIVGYVGRVFAEDLERLDYVDVNDVIGKTGVEKQYDRYLIGTKGVSYVEVDALGRVISHSKWNVKKAIPGDSVVLSINDKVQRFAYDTLKTAVPYYKATSGAVVIENVRDGSILAMASYPSYDSNLFVKGISQQDFKKILETPGHPLINKAIAAQAPPGSTFKTLVALSALDAHAISPSTVYVSSSNYKFSNGVHFQEYHNHSYGPLTVRDALMVSSNIYFCETIRHWDMDKLVRYLNQFRVGKPTGIDIPGEASGRLPSPENKIRLAKTVSPWLDPIWYPEGDACNSVIGQGITLVTPIQLVNWAAMIGNGGTLLTPHVVDKIIHDDGSVKKLNFEPKKRNIVSKDAIKIVQEGMRMSVAGSRRVIIPLTNAKTKVAGKTGTAEFGRLDSRGIYEHTHAWVIGFFPYDNPQFAFVVFLEDGGASNNSAAVARKIIDFMVDNNLVQ